MTGSGEPVLRPATHDDIGAMAATVVEAFAGYLDFAPPGWEPPPLATEVAYLEQHFATHGTWVRVAEDAGGGMAGHVLIRRGSPAIPDERVGHFGMLFVRPPWWGTGLAVRLIDAGVAAAPGLGYESLRLTTPAAHGRARRFYEREGWRLTGPPTFDRPFGMDMVVYRRSVG
ncbi:MAG: GNAT family N-acetyltransferase [Solirubrobacteraceae bacterium]